MADDAPRSGRDADLEMMRAEREQKDDWNGDSDQPQEN